jgi:DHA1 family bicyclomycin/chloramphenicol resistance-like MFS transporter
MMQSKMVDPLDAPPLWMISFLAGLGLFASAVHMPSIPAMAVDFGVTVQPIQFTISVYLAAMAIFALVVGPLSDWFGRRRVGLAMLSVFLVGSVGALFADSVPLLLTSRVIQGIGASGGLVLSRSMVKDAFTGRHAARASAQVATAVSIAPLFGPVVGGYIHHAFGWRANFLLIAVLALLLWLIALARFGETLPVAKRYVGSALSMLTNYFALLRMRHFMVYAMPVICGSVGLFTFQTEAPVLFIKFMNVRPADFGFFAAMPALGFMIGTFASSRLALHVSEGRLIVGGCHLFIISGVLITGLALGFSPSPWLVGLPMLLFGAGNGLVTPTATMGSMNAAPLLVGSAAALISGLRMGFGSIGSVAITEIPSGSAIPLGFVMFALGTIALISWRKLGRLLP